MSSVSPTRNESGKLIELPDYHRSVLSSVITRWAGRAYRVDMWMDGVHKSTINDLLDAGYLRRAALGLAYEVTLAGQRYLDGKH